MKLKYLFFIAAQFFIFGCGKINQSNNPELQSQFQLESAQGSTAYPTFNIKALEEGDQVIILMDSSASCEEGTVVAATDTPIIESLTTGLSLTNALVLERVDSLGMALQSTAKSLFR